MRRLPVWPTHLIASIFAVSGGAFLGLLDLQTSEVVMTLICMFVLNMVLGAAVPRGGWMWPVLTTIGVPLMNWFPRIVGLQANPYLHRTLWSYLLLTVILLATGLAGMLFGVIVRRGMNVV